MSIPYDDGLARDFGIGINQANVEYKKVHGIDIPYDPGMISVMSSRAAWDYYVGGMSWNDSKTKHLNEYREEYGLPPVIRPFRPAPREWRGNMCGVRVQGLAPVPGGAKDASLVVSWLYDRYSEVQRSAIRAAWHMRGHTHVVLSWPDSRSVGHSPQQFLATCQELIDSNFYPCVMLTSKDHDPPDVTTLVQHLRPVLEVLVGVVPMFCIGWELSLWLTPTQVQQLIDDVSPLCLRQPGTLVYVHFQEGYPSFQQPGGTVADFWKLQVGKLTGLLYQKILSQNEREFLDSIKDCLERFAGGFGMPRGFDYVMLEISAATQFAGTTSEGEGDRLGRVALQAPLVNGVGVSGSGNGY